MTNNIQTATKFSPFSLVSGNIKLINIWLTPSEGVKCDGVCLRGVWLCTTVMHCALGVDYLLFHMCWSHDSLSSQMCALYSASLHNHLHILLIVTCQLHGSWSFCGLIHRQLMWQDSQDMGLDLSGSDLAHIMWEQVGWKPRCWIVGSATIAWFSTAADNQSAVQRSICRGGWGV